jgi:hypothetical protein
MSPKSRLWSKTSLATVKKLLWSTMLWISLPVSAMSLKPPKILLFLKKKRSDLAMRVKTKGKRVARSSLRRSIWTEHSWRLGSSRLGSRIGWLQKRKRRRSRKPNKGRRIRRRRQRRQEKAKAKKAERAEAKKPAGTRQKVCFSIRPILVETSLSFLCRNKPLQRFLFILNPRRTKKRTGR